jgi:hypothetical protein
MRDMNRALAAALGMILAATLAAAQEAPPELARHLAALAAPDEAARAAARQLLPRAGAAAVPGLIQHLRDDNNIVARAALDVLADLAGALSAPGREAERAAMTDALLAELAGDRPPAHRRAILRLVPLAAPPDRDLAPVAAMLKEAEWREPARVALEEAGTAPARAALRAALDAAPPDFAPALLDSLARLRDAETSPLARALLDHPTPAVRAAAARAVAWRGDPSDLPRLQGVLAKADDATRAEGLDALLRLLETLGASPAGVGAAREGYAALLKSGQGAAVDAALAGLGRVGDASRVPLLLESLPGLPAASRRVAVEALRVLPGGAEVTRALVAAYPSLPADLQPGLIRALGSRRDEAALAVLEPAAKGDDPARRAAAVAALAQSGLTQGEPLLEAIARGAAEPDRPAAIAALLALGDDLAGRSYLPDAGRAFLTALELAADAATRRRALIGLARAPIPQAADAVERAANDPALKAPALPALAAVVRSLLAADQKPRALAMASTLRSLDPPTELQKAVARDLAAAGLLADAFAAQGIVPRWWVIGPFELGDDHAGWDTPYVGEPAVSLDGRFMSGKSRLAWKSVTTEDPQGRLDLRQAIANRDRTLGYVYTEILLDRPTDAVLLVGMDDGERIWVNGRKVFELFTPRALAVDGDRVPVSLQAGTNAILMKVYQETQGWEVCLRLTTPDGKPLPFTQPPAAR